MKNNEHIVILKLSIQCHEQDQTPPLINTECTVYITFHFAIYVLNMIDDNKISETLYYNSIDVSG